METVIIKSKAAYEIISTYEFKLGTYPDNQKQYLEVRKESQISPNYGSSCLSDPEVEIAQMEIEKLFNILSREANK